MPKIPKPPKGWEAADVYWYCPGRKKAIAYSTVAAETLIVALAEEGGTVRQIREKILYDAEALKVLDKYIERGFGAWIAKEHFN